MKQFLIAIAVGSGLASGGCASSSPGDDSQVKPGSGVATDLTSKPKTAEESAYNSAMQKTGNAMNSDMAKGAQAMAAAKARAEGK